MYEKRNDEEQRNNAIAKTQYRRRTAFSNAILLSDWTSTFLCAGASCTAFFISSETGLSALTGSSALHVATQPQVACPQHPHVWCSTITRWEVHVETQPHVAWPQQSQVCTTGTITFFSAHGHGFGSSSGSFLTIWSQHREWKPVACTRSNWGAPLSPHSKKHIFTPSISINDSVGSNLLLSNKKILRQAARLYS